MVQQTESSSRPGCFENVNYFFFLLGNDVEKLDFEVVLAVLKYLRK